MSMHIYFSGIGGTGIGPLALIAHQAGYQVSGSDKQASQYTDYLAKHGIKLHIGQTAEQIATEHASHPIDWIVYSSALPLEQPNHPELRFGREHGIKLSKRDECLNTILTEKTLEMVAVAGTHGKTTTTAMFIWACQQLKIPLSYSVGAKISFGDMGHYDHISHYFAYECDEFDRNFLQFHPAVSIITSVDWDHHEIYQTRDDYKLAFCQFINQSGLVFLYEKDAQYLGVEQSDTVHILNDDESVISKITLTGLHNRRNARLVIAAIEQIALDISVDQAVTAVNSFPGSSRRFERIAPSIYSDYAHTPEEVAATLQLAHELADKVVVVYEPLTDRRQHFMKDAYHSVFESAQKVYWLPSYLAREDNTQSILTPEELVSSLSPQTNAEAIEKNADLQQLIDTAVSDGAIVVCMAGGGGNSLDEWVRHAYQKQA